MCVDAFHCPRRAAAPASAGNFFDLMCQRLAAEGGLIAETALRERWRQHGRPPQALDELLDGGRLRSITSRAQRWLPAFQLDANGLTPRADVAAIAEELAGGMDAAEILAWFACRNAALDGETPIARLRAGLPAVLDAARLDRFIGSA
jgi:hypothetical protein